MTWIFSILQLDYELFNLVILVRCGKRPRCQRWHVHGDLMVNPLKFYTANLAAFLTVKRMDSPINNAEDKGSPLQSPSLRSMHQELRSVHQEVRGSLLKTFQNKWRSNMGQNLMVRLLLFSKILKFQLIKKCGRQ